MKTSFLKIGHRGAKGHAPENTLASIQKALDFGVDMIEVDVHVCKTGEVIVHHDYKLERTTNGTGYVRKRSLKYIKSLDAGNGEQVPTLCEVLDFIDKRADLNIEIKGKFALGPSLKTVERYVREHGWRYDQFIVSTFTRSKLKKLAKRHPRVRMGALLAYRPFGFVKFAKRIQAYSVHLNINLVSPKLVEDAKRQNLKVFVWTVNEHEDIRRLKEYGVDGMFSDYPDRL